jgi:hypothetical protein
MPVISAAACLRQPLQQVIAHADCIRDRGQRRVHRAEADETPGRLRRDCRAHAPCSVQHRTLWICAEATCAGFEIIGPVCILVGFYRRQAALLFVFYVVVTAVLFHNFWSFPINRDQAGRRISLHRCRRADEFSARRLLFATAVKTWPHGLSISETTRDGTSPAVPNSIHARHLRRSRPGRAT